MKKISEMTWDEVFDFCATLPEWDDCTDEQKALYDEASDRIDWLSYCCEDCNGYVR